MINLLPPYEKEKLLSEKTEKLTMVLGITIIIPLLCFILILFSIKFYILGEVNSQKIVLEQAKKEYQTPDFLMFMDIIEKNDKVLVNLESFYKKETYVTEALKIISGFTRPKNVYFTNMSLDRNPDGKIKVAASGFSASRDDLLLFQKNINEDPKIKNVNFSPESWVSPQNTTFDLTFDLQ